MKLPMNRSKYNVGPKAGRIVDGITFDSAAEGRRYSELRILERAGMLFKLQRQKKIPLQPEFSRDGKRYSAITYIADFLYYEVQTGHTNVIIEDVKGARTAAYRIKKKMLMFVYPQFQFREIEAK